MGNLLLTSVEIKSDPLLTKIYPRARAMQASKDQPATYLPCRSQLHPFVLIQSLPALPQLQGEGMVTIVLCAEAKQWFEWV